MSLPPGPPLPALAQTLLFIAIPTQFGEALSKRYGDIYTFKNTAFGTEVILQSPELVRQVFTGDPDVLHAGEANRGLGAILGDRSVLLLDGKEHLRHRRLMLPPFHGERMQAYAETMRSICEEEVARWREGATFSLHPGMQRVTLDIILRTVFGIGLGPRHDDLRDRLTTVFNRIQSPIGMLMMMPELQRDLGPFTPWSAFQRELAAADALIFAEIEDRRAERAQATASGEGEGSKRRDDVLSMLLDAKDEQGQGLTDRELRDELMTLLAAGHETTATAICWAFERILNHPEVEKKLRQELDEVLGDRPITSADLPKLEYLDATIKEVMRLRPALTGVGRRLTEPMAIGGYDLPAGTVLVPSIFAVHRRADLYPEPERFLPERFLGKKLDPYSYFPFGGGVRRCIGMAFALYEMKIMMATMLQKTKLVLAKKGSASVVLRSFVFAPQGGTRVRFVKRLTPSARREAPKSEPAAATSTMAS